MNCVDIMVKEGILNYPSIYPTRLHVLSHCLLGNGTGYEWIEKEDGLLYLEQFFTRRTEPLRDTIEMNEPLEHSNGELHLDMAFDNAMRQWINDNIDEYCKATYHHNWTDRLLPRARYYMVSRNYNRFDDIEDFSKVAPEWLDAMKEVCEHYMTDIAKLYSGSPYLNCLDSIKCPMFSQYYSFLQTWLAAINALPHYKKQQEFMQKAFDEIFKDLD